MEEFTLRSQNPLPIQSQNARELARDLWNTNTTDWSTARDRHTTRRQI